MKNIVLAKLRKIAINETSVHEVDKSAYDKIDKLFRDALSSLFLKQQFPKNLQDELDNKCIKFVEDYVKTLPKQKGVVIPEEDTYDEIADQIFSITDDFISDEFVDYFLKEIDYGEKALKSIPDSVKIDVIDEVLKPVVEDYELDNDEVIRPDTKEYYSLMYRALDITNGTADSQVNAFDTIIRYDFDDGDIANALPIKEYIKKFKNQIITNVGKSISKTKVGTQLNITKDTIDIWKTYLDVDSFLDS